MIIQQFFVPGIAHSSYIVAGDRTCVSSTPPATPERYLRAAREMGVRITHILETHLHADFVSGHLDLLRQPVQQSTHPRKGTVHSPITQSPKDPRYLSRISGSPWSRPPGTPLNPSVTWLPIWPGATPRSPFFPAIPCLSVMLAGLISSRGGQKIWRPLFMITFTIRS